MRCEIILNSDREMKKLSQRVGIVVPAFNEADHLRDVLSACRAIGPSVILVVDDCSTDETRQILAGEVGQKSDGTRVSFLHNERNLGKQGSVRRGFQALATHDLDAVALLDGDGQHDPRELPGLVALLDRYDFVIGARLQDQMPIQRRFSNWFVNLCYRWLAGVDFVDVQSGLRVYRKQLADALGARLPEQGGYALEHESLVQLARVEKEQGLTLRAAAVRVSCAYGAGTSSMRTQDILQLTHETVRQALRFRRVREMGALAGVGR